MRSTSDLSPLFARHRVLVCVGAGGVGKTTVAAALALAAARSGKRTLCLTIDPARRLAGSLGLAEFPLEALEITPEFLKRHGVELAAPLTVMMLDARSTFDALIRKFSASEQEAERIINHQIYHHLASSLAGTQSYMAMEKVLSVLDDERYDLVILDTPPSARALDFFDAPQKMSEILDSPATRALVQALDRGRRLKMGVLAAGIRRAMKGLERITGTSLISDVAELLAEMNGLFGGFSDRAAEVDRRLHDNEFGYVLVSAPSPSTLADAQSLVAEMRGRSLSVSALVMNRCASPGLAAVDSSDVKRALPDISDAGQQTIVELVAEESRRQALQSDACAPLLRDLGDEVGVAFVPAFADDVHEPGELMAVAGVLAPGLASLS